jgi:hypothetical protein
MREGTQGAKFPVWPVTCVRKQQKTDKRDAAHTLKLVVEGRFPPSGAYRPSRRSLPLTEPSLLLRGTQLWPCKSTHKQYNSGDSELRKKIPV